MNKPEMIRRSVMEIDGCLMRLNENFLSVLAKLLHLRECLKEIWKELVVSLRKPLWRQRRKRRLNSFKKMIPDLNRIKIFADPAFAKNQRVESFRRLRRSL